MAAKQRQAVQTCLLIRTTHTHCAAILLLLGGQPHGATHPVHVPLCAVAAAASHTHTHTCALSPSLSYYLLAAVSVLLPASAHLHNSNMAFLSSLSSLARAAAAAAPVGGGHIKAFTWQHIQLHAICINCLSLSLSLPHTVCLFLLLLLLPVSLNYCHLISAITTHFCATICPLCCLSLSVCLSQLA